jgi:site-specific DNA-methyltransferase (adenine-specific)
MKEMSPESVDVIITDPPYLMDYVTNLRVQTRGEMTRKIEGDNSPDLIRTVFPLMYNVLKKDSVIYCFCRAEWKSYGFFCKNMEKAGFEIHNTIVWKKDAHTAGNLHGEYGRIHEWIIFAHKGKPKMKWEKRGVDHIFCSRVNPNEMVHPNEKPIQLLKQLVFDSTNEDDTVFDPFAGSGTTGEAAWEAGRNVILCEKDLKRYEVLLTRMSRVTSQNRLF